MLELSATSSSRAGRSSPPTVLLVDSDRLYRWFVTEALGASGVQVVPFASMADAAAYLDGDAGAEFLLVDGQTLNDEGPAGRAALRRGAAVVPCVLLSAAHPVGADLEAPEATIVEKPIDLGRLLALVERRLAGVPMDVPAG